MKPAFALIACTAIFCTALASCSLLPDSQEERRAKPVRTASSQIATNAESRQCLAALAGTQATFQALPDAYSVRGCSAVNSVRLSQLASDGSQMTVTNVDRVYCPLANDFAAWVRFGVDRAARAYLESPLARIETMGSYACRNVAGSARKSAHASAQAIDVSAFVLADGRRITVKAGWLGSAEERQFLRRIHASACRRFGTVLGPQYNADHGDHFHLEYGGGGFCL